MSEEQELTEKQRIEKRTAIVFLDLYNEDAGTNFQFQELSDTPDVLCLDPDNGQSLGLEISLLEDLPGDVAYVLGRGDKPISPTTKSTVVSLFEDVTKRWAEQLEDKLLSSYGADTALVFRQVSPLWEPKEWELVADDFRNTVLKGKQKHYGAGVWVICIDNEPFPAVDTLFRLN